MSQEKSNPVSLGVQYYPQAQSCTRPLGVVGLAMRRLPQTHHHHHHHHPANLCPPSPALWGSSPAFGVQDILHRAALLETLASECAARTCSVNAQKDTLQRLARAASMDSGINCDGQQRYDLVSPEVQACRLIRQSRQPHCASTVCVYTTASVTVMSSKVSVCH